MNKDFSDIGRITALRQQRDAIDDQLRQLTRPVMTDTREIPHLFGIFLHTIGQDKTSAPKISATERRKFIFAILCLYCPAVLAGGRIPNGIRSALSRVFPEVVPTVISGYLPDIMFLYRHYNSFRQDVAMILEAMTDKG